MVNFCPHCGSKLQPDFKFCPSCGGKLPEDPTEPVTLQASEFLSNSVHHSVSCTKVGAAEEDSGSALNRSPLRSARRKSSAATPTNAVKCTEKKSSTSPQNEKTSPPQKEKTSPQVKEQQEEAKQTSSLALQTPDKKSLISLGKRKASPHVKEEETKQTSVLSPSPSKCKSRKRVSTVEPVQEGTMVCDQSGKKWKLVELLWQTELDLTYAACQVNKQTDSNNCKYILRLGGREGHLFNEQNFHQRAAKTDAVEKWVKLHKIDFLGIPSCVGFGIHEAYRFLVFPNMGQTLQSIMDERTDSLSEKAVLQLALRLLELLEFIHEKEYTHADIHAGNIFINTDSHTEVFLSGFGYAFRYCPGGKHVEERPGSRTAHQGNVKFISLDSHMGAGPSRCSDLQSLGYCMLSWTTGTLPWSHLTHSSSAIAAEKKRYKSDISGLVSFCYKKSKASSALTAYLSNVMALQYCEKPDYSLLKAGLHESLQKMGGTLKEPLDL
ncbi:inactive serine/threonine-protein kinase VRK3 isoform X1 [Triplophysa rosa]|uniref:inactive serine/threonine-protein kinase VRK3 isoform X1 n=1 Tax=Triplophysa rosa TaxID=992332 RepID=UPI0025461F24|nr:inactive serine/threonine-protein kinase VRK3 isoform X1 [Triplophysa rosa]